MDDNHITEPLDYLYEELPPGRMAEVRKHLSECPECRAQMRAIRETVKLYRRLPHPKPPGGLAARAARAAIAEADKGAVGLLRGRYPAAAMAAALDQIGAENEPAAARPALSAPAPAPASPSPELRQAQLEEDFNLLKKEVKEEMRRGWREWFFHPGWTVAASALLISSLAIHFSPRTRYEQPVYLRETVPLEGAAREIRNRERIPVPQPHVAAEAPSGEAAPPVLQQAKARRDLPLPSLAQMRAMTRPTAAPTPAPALAPTPAPAPVEMAAEDAPSLAEAVAEVSAPALALASAPEPPAQPRVAAPRMASVAPPPAPLAAAVEPAPEPEPIAMATAAAAPMPKAEAEEAVVAERAQAEDSESPRPPAVEEPEPPATAAGPVETTPALAADELAALAAAPVEADAGSPTVVDLAGMEPPQLIARPEGFDIAERVRTLTALAGMQMASGEIADAWQTVEMLRRYDAKAAEELSVLLAEMEKTALAEQPVKVRLVERTPPPEPEPEPEPRASKYDAFVPAPVAAPVPVPVPVAEPEIPVEMVEPPEDPPLSAAPEPAPMIIPLQVYIQPPVPAPAVPPRQRFTTDPYLRDD